MKQSINLIAKEQSGFLDTDVIKKIVIFFMVALAVIMFMMVLWFGAKSWQYSRLKQTSDRLLAQPTQVMSVEHKKLIQQRDKLKEALLVANQTELYMQSSANPKYSFILMGLGKSKVDGVWISKIYVEKEKREVVIDGHANDVKSVMAMLKNLKKQIGFKQTQLQLLKLAKNSEGHFDFTMLGHYAEIK